VSKDLAQPSFPHLWFMQDQELILVDYNLWAYLTGVVTAQQKLLKRTLYDTSFFHAIIL
jgi:hypothetical protein